MKSRPHRSPWLASLILLIAIPAFADRAPLLVHSNDVHGELEPCGCRANPSGGLLRKLQMLRTHELTKGRSSSQILQLDAGDLFFSTQEVPETLRAQTEIQALALARSLRLTGLKAFVPGEKDFALGASFLKRLAKEGRLDLLAANLEEKVRNRWRRLGTASRVFPMRSSAGTLHRVGVIGIVGSGVGLPPGLRATSPIAAARAEVSKLRKKTDWLVLLTHQGFDDDVTLAEAVPGIDFIIGAHSQSFLQKPWIIEKNGLKTSIHQSSFRNQAVGLIELRPSGRSELVALDDSQEPAATEFGDLRKVIEEAKNRIAEVNHQEEKRISALAEEKNREGTPKFQTLNKCADCHFKQFDFWRKTPHASAYEVLVKAGQHQNLECLSCHTVGLGDPEGFTRLHQLVEWEKKEKTEKPGLLEDWLKQVRTAEPARAREVLGRATRVHATVQCENCHGPGRDHPFGLETLPKVVATQSCLKCHTPVRAPGWYVTKQGKEELDQKKLSENMKKLACPAGSDD